MDPLIVPPLAIAVAWVLREVIPVAIAAWKRAHSVRPPPPPPPRSEMPTPDFSAPATRSGAHYAVSAEQATMAMSRDQYATRAELAELGAELRDLFGDLARRLEIVSTSLSRDVGRLEGMIEHLRPTQRGR